ncbi:hypothetical protein FA15DRAFT_668468 [Coprinopsis marcescibilis]|uniref:Calcium uniporter protein, mitochondrial n=1 Tax=Coprinopsis marcescibilis TaxID=230819 RepID=A0A5C3KYX6_COPMA|nr:hypothetical protein FA15DRAFT_668468 [Coprinopsis marcescibilis]
MLQSLAHRNLRHRVLPSTLLGQVNQVSFRYFAARRGHRAPTHNFSGLHGRAEAVDDANVVAGHSRFLAEAPATSKWEHAGLGKLGNGENVDDLSKDEYDGVTQGKGKILPTSSHLFKLILPLGDLSHPANGQVKPSTPGIRPSRSNVPPTVILLHPSQPLSHVGRLITLSLAPATPIVSFRSASAKGLAFQWSDSTDVGDFIRDAARSAHFSICITYSANERLRESFLRQEHARPLPVNRDSSTREANFDDDVVETVIQVDVPTFADRTQYIRRRLSKIERELHSLESIKRECDVEAHRGARRMAVTGFGMLVVYWASVARLTFWDYGWDVMEPVTYLSGLSTVVLGYLWFLYQGREVSYSSVLSQSISRRREILYHSKGLDLSRWEELVSERSALRKEIGRIAEDYGDRLPREDAQKDEQHDQRESSTKDPATVDRERIAGARKV